MAKFKLAADALTFGGTTLTCLQSVDISADASAIEIECAGATAKEKLAGLPSYTLNFSGALETDDVTLLNAIQPNDTGAVTLDPAGKAATTIDISSTNGTVTSFSVSFPANGFAVYSGSIGLDDFTVAANSA